MKRTLLNSAKLAVIFLLLLPQSCVELYTPLLAESNSGSLLVVEGLITNETGPFKVKLTESVPLYNDPNQLYQEHAVNGAFVQIFDDNGNAYTLFEGNNGWYETENKKLSAKIGSTYTLTITTADGKQYESSPVLMLDSPGINKIHYSENTNTIVNEGDVYEEKQIKIMVDSEIFEEGIGYLKWDFEETWEFELPTYILVDHGTGEGSRPATLEKVNVESERKYCWVSESSNAMLVESSVSYADNNVTDFVLQTISPPDDRLNIKYSILVKQYAINRELYNYFKKLRDLNENTGGMYDKNPAEIIGNIVCCNGENKALGYFFASDTETKRIFINRSEHSLPDGSAYLGCGWTTDVPRYLPTYYMAEDRTGANIYSTNEYCVDCRRRGNNNKPDFWE